VPDETPRDPVVAAAEGEQAGEPWRLVVFRSTYRPGGGRPPVADVCYILDWFALGPGPPAWQAHGTCAPEAQAASVLAAGRFGTGGRDTVAVIGPGPGQRQPGAPGAAGAAAGGGGGGRRQGGSPDASTPPSFPGPATWSGWSPWTATDVPSARRQGRATWPRSCSAATRRPVR
jgi:hypothetical protein